MFTCRKNVTRDNENVSKDYDVHSFRMSYTGSIKVAKAIIMFCVKCDHRIFSQKMSCRIFLLQFHAIKDRHQFFKQHVPDDFES